MIQLDMFPDFEEIDERSTTKKDRRLTKENIFGLEYCEGALHSGKYEMPKLEKYTDLIPSEFVSLTDLRPSNKQEAGVSTFEEDYVLERLWNNPDKSLPRILEHPCIIEPDFSIKIGMPVAAQIANCFRSHALGYYMHKKGAKVIPDMKWGSKQTFDFCFDGYAKGGAVAVSTIGTLSDERSRMYFRSGFMEMLQRISPDAIILYGDVNDELMALMPTQIAIHHVPHSKFLRARKNGR